MAKRYGRAQFIKDATRLGLSPDKAFARSELRRRRDHLMAIHHPDRGGDTRKAARINEIYGRMVEWLAGHEAREFTRNQDATRPAARGHVARAQRLTEGLKSGASRVWGAALIAAAAYAALRRKSNP